MNKLTKTLAIVGLGAALFSIPAFTQEHGEGSREGREEHSREGQKEVRKTTDADLLYELVRQARIDLETLRKLAGVPASSREGRGEHGEGSREGRGEHGEGSREGRGEHGEGGREGSGEHGGQEGGEEGEEGGQRLEPNQTWDETRNGAHLLLAYNAESQSFRGVVTNVTKKTLSDVRVEVHLSNGLELGPTKRTDLKPGAKMRVELSAAGQKFSWWTTHPEHGSEEGHGPGHEGEGKEGSGGRPANASLRPVYNELQLLRQEIKRISASLKSRKKL